jgi:hypothetical protein
MTGIALYRRILRLHRGLPSAQRSLGDDYVQSEFRRHQTINDAKYLLPFFAEWQRYAETLAEQLQNRPKQQELHQPEKRIGKQLTLNELDRFSEEQIGQLFELKKETEKIK